MEAAISALEQEAAMAAAKAQLEEACSAQRIDELEAAIARGQDVGLQEELVVPRELLEGLRRAARLAAAQAQLEAAVQARGVEELEGAIAEGVTCGVQDRCGARDCETPCSCAGLQASLVAPHMRFSVARIGQACLAMLAHVFLS